MLTYRFSDFFYSLIYFCAPVLGKLKCGNLFSFEPSESEDLEKFLDVLNGKFEKYGIRFSLFCCCNQRSLIYVYNSSLLEKILSEKNNSEFLECLGYRKECSVEEKILLLKNKFRTGESFPHEIGIFLDYPLEDVKGFITNKGANYKFCGKWKVYGDCEKAKKKFQTFDLCTKKMIECYKSEKYSVEEIIRLYA